MKKISVYSLLVAVLSVQSLMISPASATVCNPVTKVCSGGHPG